jgi:hypothetical protein
VNSMLWSVLLSKMNEVLFILIITDCNNYLSVFLGYKARYTWIFVSRHPFVFIKLINNLASVHELVNR